MFGYVTGALAYLPLPSAFALSTALQKRIVQYVLKAALGKLIKNGDVQLDQIEAEISSGHLEIRKVHIDVDYLNTFLADTGVQLRDGLIGSISISIPWSNLREGDVAIKVVGVDVNAHLGVAHLNVRKATESLGESIFSAAEDAIEVDENGKEIEASIASLLDDPDSENSDVKGGVNVFIARQLSNIAARTKVSVSNILLRMQSDAFTKDMSMQIRLDEVALATSNKVDGSPLRRTISLTGLTVWIDNGDLSFSAGLDDDDRSGSSNASSTSLGEEHRDMEGSMAASVYASAMGIESVYESTSVQASAQRGQRTMRERGSQLIAKIGVRPIVIAITPDIQASDVVKQVHVSVECDQAALFVSPVSIASLLRFIAACQDITAQVQKGEEMQESTASQKEGFEFAFSLGHLDALMTYTFVDRLDTEAYEVYKKSLQEFWSNQNQSSPHISHLRVRADRVVVEAKTSEDSQSLFTSIDDLGLYEYLAQAASNGGPGSNKIMPILVLDHNLPGAITRAKGMRMPSMADWRTQSPSRSSGGPYVSAGFSRDSWKVSAGIGPEYTGGLSNKQVSHAMSMIYEKTQARAASISASSDPIHLFLDTTTILRVLPCIQRIGMIVTSDWKNDRPLAQSTATLLAASTTRNDFDHLQPSWTVSCPLIRVEVRAHLDENIESIGDTLGLSTRSGIIAIDFIEVHLEQADCKHEYASSVRFTEPGMGSRTEFIPTFTYPQQQTKLTMSELHISHLTPQATQDTQFATISPIRSKDQAESAVRPTLTYAAGTPKALDMLMPSIELEMSKGLLTYLEFLADDLSLWNARVHGWYEHISAQKTTNALRILGSRFFGSRYSYSTLSDSSVSTEIGRDKGTNRPTLNALIHEATLRIYLPAMDTQEQQAQSTAEHLEDPGHLTCHANEIQAQFDGAYSETASSLRLTLAGLSVRHSARQEIILEQTLGNPLGQLRRPVLNIQVISTVERDTSFRGSQINILFCNSTISYDGDVSFIRQLQAFAKAPQGIFEHVEPNEVTRLSLQIEDVTFLLCPKRTTARAAIVVGLLTLRSKVISDYPRNATKLTLNNSGVYIGETLSEKNNNDIRARRVTELWHSRGLSRVLQASGVEVVSTKSTLTLPEIDLHVNGGQVEGMACADTAKVLQAIAVEFTYEIDRSSKSAKPDRQRSQTDLRQPVGVFNEVEDHCYSKTLEDVSDMDLLEDDVPYHLNAYGEKVVGNVNRGQTILQNDLVTVRLLDTERGIQPQSGFFSDPNLHVERRSKGAPGAPHFRLAVRNVDVFLHLYGGFDAGSTRKAFEDEAKRVRRRLQRIKQMLDQGQIPDDSVEEATATLFDSMHVSLPKGRTAADMNATELMQVVDEEMDDQTETASTASTWKQFVPGRVDSPTFSSKRKRSKLARSKDSMIEFELKGIRVDFDSFDDGDADVQSKLDLRVRSLRILDHIKTSTWQTFLTGMSSSALRLGESQPDMVRLELTSVLSTSGRSDNELRCRSRISPLRLHVDQDALDFLKKFFMLEIPGQPAPAAPSSNIELGPFIQHAEVFPILLKLDYKPKRVDYQLLRQGKTIEMMNFFNFEASEITLRHITLRGVMGWPALFDMLNDMWTPDVKANQLADVLSGITPIRSLVNVGNGVADLILLPIEHYQRDGRLGRGLKEGAKRFVKTTALEAARVGARLATGTQVILERTEHVLGGGTRQMDEQRGVVTGSRSPMRQSDEESEEETEGMTEQPDQISRYASRPGTMRQALGEAQRGLSRGLNEAAQTILAVPMEVYDRQAGEGRGRPVVRAVPIAVLRGAAGASEAISKTLQGVERGLAGSRFAEAEEIEAKYKKRGKEKDTAKR